MPHIPYVFLTSIILVSRVFATHAHLRHLRCLGVRCTHIVRSFGTSEPASSPDVPNGGLHSLIRVFATHAHLRHLRCLGGRCTHIVRSFGTSGPASSPGRAKWRTACTYSRIRDERSPSTPSVPRWPLHSYSPLFWHVRTCKQPGRAKWRTAFVAHTLIVSQSVFVVKKMLPDFYGRRYRYPPLPGGSAPAGSAVLPQRLP